LLYILKDTSEGLRMSILFLFIEDYCLIYPPVIWIKPCCGYQWRLKGLSFQWKDLWILFYPQRDHHIKPAICSPILYRFEGCQPNLWIIILPLTIKQISRRFWNISIAHIETNRRVLKTPKQLDSCQHVEIISTRSPALKK